MVKEEEIPQRSNLWLDQKGAVSISGKLFDPITRVFFIVLAIFSFIVFWPIVSVIEFKAAFAAPAVPFLINIFKTFGLQSEDTARIIFMFAFMAATAGIYLFVRDLIFRQVSPIFAALLYIIPPVPLFVLSFLSRGLNLVELASAESFLSVIYGQLDSFLALSLIPFAAIFFLRFLKNGSSVKFTAGTVIAAVIFLTNQSQSLSLILVLSVLTVTELFLGQARLKLRRFLQFLAVGGLLCAFWYLPIFLSRPQVILASPFFSNLKYLFPLPFIVGTLSLLFSFVVFGRREDRQGIFASFLLFIVFFSLTADWLINGRTYAAHPNRLISDLMMFSAMVLALSISMFFDKLNLVKYLNFENWPTAGKILGTITFGLFSFLVILIGSILVSPLAIKFVSGPYGIWIRVKSALILDRDANIGAGENFRLISQVPLNWQLYAGIAISLGVLVILIFNLLKNLSLDEDTDNGS